MRNGEEERQDPQDNQWVNLLFPFSTCVSPGFPTTNWLVKQVLFGGDERGACSGSAPTDETTDVRPKSEKRSGASTAAVTSHNTAVSRD